MCISFPFKKTGGVDNKVTTTIYSDYDTAKNPFRKLYLVNEDFYEKGLSANNFRAKKTTSQYLPTPANGNMIYPPAMPIANGLTTTIPMDRCCYIFHLRKLNKSKSTENICGFL